MLRKIILIIAAAVFVFGVYGVFHRKNPADKYIGKVYIANAENENEIKGYTKEKLYNDKKSTFDVPEISELADDLYVINKKSTSLSEAETKSDMSIVFQKDYVGDVLYTIYDSDFKEIQKSEKTLKIPGDKANQYYVKIQVIWGKSKTNVTMIYYFKINFE